MDALEDTPPGSAALAEAPVAGPVSNLTPIALRVVRTVRKWRRIRDLSQRELAARAGIGEKHLGEIERGLRDPRLTTIIRLFVALELSRDETPAFWADLFDLRPQLHSPAAGPHSLYALAGGDAQSN